MLISVGQALISACAVGACGGDGPFGVGTDHIPQAGPTLAVAQSAPNCGTISVTITGSGVVTALFPTAGACPQGPSVVGGGTATYVKGSRRLTLPLQIVNRGPGALQPVISLLLNKDSAIVTTPSGQGGTFTFHNADSIVPSGQPNSGQGVWVMSASAPLSVGASTASRSVQVTIPNKATGVRLGFVVQAVLPDTGWPTIPSAWTEILDSSVTTVASSDASIRYFRHRYAIVFGATTSGLVIRDFMQRHSATIVGGDPFALPRGAYIIAIPDPGASYSAVQALEAQLRADSGVVNAFALTYRGKLDFRGRYPSDGNGNQRSDWFLPSTDLSAWLQVRAPLAWSCENGAYSAIRPKVGVVDFSIDVQQTDFAGLLTTDPLTPNPATLVHSPSASDPGVVGLVTRSHGTSVASILASVGDNGVGIAGMLWAADLRFYAYGEGNQQARTPVLELDRYMADAAANGVRVVVTSQGVGNVNSAGEVDFIRSALDSYLAGGNVVVIASGNNGLTLPIGSLAGATDPRLTALDKAAAQLFALYPHQVVFVAGAEQDGTFDFDTNFWTGAMAVLAPSENVEVLARSEAGGSLIGNGSSYSAPFVAGMLAQLWSMAPSLTPAELHDYLIRGSRESRRSHTTGLLIPASPVPDAPSTAYVLDAYGSLSLLSRERLGAPICGYPVTNGGITGSILLAKGPSDTVPLIAGLGSGYVGRISVAPGGRLVSAWVGSDPVTGSRRSLLQSSW